MTFLSINRVQARHHPGRLFMLLMAIAGVTGCGKRVSDVDQSGSTPIFRMTPDESHRAMIRLLDKVQEQTADTNSYLGDFELRNAAAYLPTVPPTQPDVRLQVLGVIASHKLRLGRTESAITDLLEAERLLSQIPEPARSQLKVKVLYMLGVAYLRKAETENCVHCANGERCIIPIQGNGVHEFREGSEKACEKLEELLAAQPDNPAAAWMLNLAKMTLGRYPASVPERYRIPKSVFEDEESFPRFPNISIDLGLDTFNLSGGAIVEDFDGDGDLDILTSTWNPAERILYFRHNNDGTFTEMGDKVGLAGIRGGLNMLQADYDNDGDLDALVLRGAWLGKAGRHPNSLLANDGKGNFRDVTIAVGLGDDHFPTQTASWADFDNDGDLDLYIGNEDFPCQLFENRNGHFVDIARRAGVENGGLTKGVIWGDFDNDRLVDLYVSNLFGANRLYRNRGDGRFDDVAKLAGVERPQRSFPTWFWDFNNDGILDLYVSAYWATVDHFARDYFGKSQPEIEADHLYLGTKTGRFREVAREMGTARITLPMGSNFGDLNNDGYQDYYLGTGNPEIEALMPNRMFLNQAGKSFREVTVPGRFGHLQKGHGVAFADLDHDGDQDIFIQMGGASAGDGFKNALFANPGFGNHWIKISLVGVQSNRFGIGARLSAQIKESGKTRTIYKWVNSGGSFGANSLRQQLGLGKASTIGRLEVFWPTSGTTQVFEDVEADQWIEIKEDKKSYVKKTLRKLPFPMAVSTDQTGL